jgi:GNAT superfamily N-acetyltransferase
MSEFTIRPALPAEAQTLSAVAMRLFRETYADQIPPADLESYVTSAFHPEAQLAEITCPGGTVLIALDGPEPVAYAQLRPGRAAGSLEVARFYVASRFHGSGLATRLMQACLDWAAPNYQSLWLQVWEANPRAIRFYEKLGFSGGGETTFKVGSILYRDRIMVRPINRSDAPG